MLKQKSRKFGDRRKDLREVPKVSSKAFFWFDGFGSPAYARMRGAVLLLIAVVIFAAIGLTPSQAASGINEQLNFQARLLNADGSISDDGNYHVRFKIYRGGNGDLGGGDETLEWTEAHTTGNLVRVINGYLSVQLNSITNDFSTVTWNDDTLWLSMEIGGIGGSPSWDGELDPFMRLSAVPQAINSQNLGGRGADEFVQLDPGASPQNVNTANSAIAVNQQGAGNLLQLQGSGADVLTVDNSGNLVTTGDISLDGNIKVENNQAVQFELAAGGSYRSLLSLGVTDDLYLGYATDIKNLYLRSGTGTTIFQVGGSEVGRIDSVGQFTLGTSVLQGASVLNDGNGNTATIETVAALGNDVTYQFGAAAAGTYEICTDEGNCAASGVTSLNTASGVLTIANASESSGTITIDDASTSQSGLVNTASQTFIGTKGFQSAITVGVNDSDNGVVTVYGSNTGTSSGAILRLYTAADYDTTVNYFDIRAIADDLQFRAGGSIVGRFIDNSGQFRLGSSSLDGSLALYNNGFRATVSSDALTANRTYTLPNDSGTICLEGASGCGFLADGDAVDTVGALDGGTANATGATISGDTLFLQSASASNSGLLNTTTQSFAGYKTFEDGLRAGDGVGEASLSVNGGSSGSQRLSFTTAGSTTWSIGAIGGGSNPSFNIQRYNAGAYVDSPINVSNTTGNVTISHDTIISGSSTLSVGGDVTIGGVAGDDKLEVTSGNIDIDTGDLELNDVVRINNSGAFIGTGAGITLLDAGNISTGTLVDARLSANVSLLGSSISGSEIANNTIEEVDLEATNAATDNYILSYDSGSGGFTWVVDGVGTTYTAGNGLSLAADEFSINSPTCAGTTKLQWNGTAFICSADVDTNTQLSEATVEAYIFDGDNSGTLSSGTLALGSLSYTGVLTDTNVSNTLTIGATSTVADGALSVNVAFLDGTQTFTGTNTFSGQVNANDGLYLAANTGISYAGNYKTYERTYNINTATPSTLLDDNGAALSVTKSYRLRGVITSTGTATGATAVLYGNGTVFTLSKTYEAGTSSNHIEFYLDGGVPKVRLFSHGSLYNVSVLVEEVINKGRSFGPEINLYGNASGYIGIGTTSGDDRLEVTGNIDINGNLEINDTIRISSTGAFTGTGANITSLNASNISTGTLNNSRLNSNVSLLGSSIDLTSEITGVLGDSNVSNTLTIGSSSTVADGALSANVALLSSAQTFTGVKTFSSQLTASGGLKVSGTDNITDFDGAGLTVSGSTLILDTSYLDTNYAEKELFAETLTTTGWYRIATNGPVTTGGAGGTRASARFNIRDIASGRHSTSTVYASVNYGSNPTLNLVNRSFFGSSGAIKKVRIVEGSTYEGAAFEVYFDNGGVATSVSFSMYDNDQAAGWTAVDWTAGSIPGGFATTALDFDTYNPVLATAANSNDNGFIVDRDGDVIANSFAGNGALLTALNASNISTGALADARLSVNVTKLGSSISLTSEISGILPVANGGTGATTLNNLITLGSHTVGNYLATATGNSQIAVSGSGSESAGISLSVVANSIGDTQLTYNTGQHLTTTSGPTFSDLNLTGSNAIVFDGGDAMITTHDGFGNFSILNGINNSNVITAADGGTRLELSESGSFDVEIYSGTVGTAGSETASYLFAGSELYISGANLNVAGDILTTGSTRISSSGALTVTTGSFSGLLTANAGIDLNNTNLDDVQFVYFDQSNSRISDNASGLIFDGGDGTNDFLVYDNNIYSDTLRLGYSGSAQLTTYDTNESLAINTNGTGSINLNAATNVSGALQFSALNCTGNTNGGALTTDASGNVSCSDDDSGNGYWSQSGSDINYTSGDVYTQTTSTTAFEVRDASSDAVLRVDTSTGDGIITSDFTSTVTSSGTSETLTNYALTADRGTATVVGSDGIPVFAYYQSGDLTFRRCTDEACATTSAAQTLDSASDVVDNDAEVSIGIGSDGFPMIAYLDDFSDDLNVYDCGNVGCTSGSIRAVDTSGARGQHVSMIIPADGIPVISHMGFDGGNNKFWVTKCGNSSCSTSSTSTELGSGSTSAKDLGVAVGSNGFPFIAYIDFTGGGTSNDVRAITCTNAACTASSNSNVGNNIGDDHPSPVVGLDGIPVIGFRGAGGFNVLVCDNAACTSATSGSVGGSGGGPYFDLKGVLNADGLPMWVFRDAFPDDATADLAIAVCDSVSCASTTVTVKDGVINESGSYPAIALKDDGNPFITHITRNNGDIRTISCVSTDCISASSSESSTTGGVQIGTVSNIFGGLHVATINNGNDEAYFQVSDTGKVSIKNFGVASATHVCRNSTTGELTKCSSNRRYKKNIQDLTLDLNTIRSLSPRQFDWRNNGTADLGFIAEEVELVNPLLAQYEANGELSGVKYSQMSALLVQGIKELDVQVQDIDERLGMIEAALNGAITVNNLTVNGNAQFTGDLTVAGTITVANIIVEGHIVTAGNTPTITAATNTTATVSGNDIAGEVAVITTGVVTGIIATIDFDEAYAATPRISLTPTSADAAAAAYFVERTLTGFEIRVVSSLANGLDLSFDYQILE